MTQKLIVELLDAPLPEAMELAIRAEDGMDPITRSFGDTPASERTVEKESREDFIFRNLGHMRANPSNAARKEAIIESYTFGSPRTAGAAQEEGVVNADTESVASFIEEIISACKYQQRRVVGEGHGAANEDRLFILHGPRGCGKTFFLNYMLANFADRLDLHKIMWVRIDLTKESWLSNDGEVPASSDLLEWCFAQVTKIALRYYNSGSKMYAGAGFDLRESGLFEHLKSYIEACEFAELKLQMQQAYLRMIEVFQNNVQDQPLRRALVQSDLTRQVMSFLSMKLGCGFVIILDGFDRLDITPKDIARHDRLVEEVGSLAGAAEALGFVLLCVMRTNTLSALPNPYRRVPIARSFRVAAHPLKGILKTRVAYLIKRVPLEAKGRENWRLDDWPAHLENFISFVEEKEDDGRNSRLEQLSSIFDKNRRAQMQIIQLAYFDFLGLSRSLQYRLIERMVKAGFRYPPRHYKYERVGRKILPLRADDIGLDNRFVPCLFSFPCVAGRDSFQHTRFDLLMGLRILQLVKAFEKYRARVGDTQPLAVFEVCNVLSSLFNYDKNMITRLIVEYAEFEIWSLGGELVWNEGNLNELRIHAQGKMEFMLERCVFDIAYLSLAIMRSAIGAKTRTSRERAAPLIAVATFDRGDGEGRLGRWIECKFLNSVSVYRLMRELNDMQAQRWVQAQRQVPHERRYLDIRDAFGQSKPFDFIKRMRQDLPKEMESLLRTPIGAGERPIDNVEMRDAITNYARSWCARLNPSEFISSGT